MPRKAKKTRSASRLPWTQAEELALRSMWADCSALTIRKHIPGRTWAALRQKAFYLGLSFGYRKRAGIERRVRFHDLRHTCASHLLMGTWGVRLSIEEVSAWLGHSSTAVTQRYAHLAPDHLSARVGAALRGPTGSPSAGSAVSSPNAQKPLENTGRAMQESNLRPSASETDAPRAKTPCPPTNRTPADPPRTHDRVAVAVLEVAARGEPLPRGLVAELARAALACGVASADVARMWVAGPTQARAVVEVAVMVAATVADEAARAAGE